MQFDLTKESVVVVVCSTTGDGEPPENAARFWRQLKSKALPAGHLAHLRYVVLGLGDTNYSSFCQMGKEFARRFLELGAQPVRTGRPWQHRPNDRMPTLAPACCRCRCRS